MLSKKWIAVTIAGLFLLPVYAQEATPEASPEAMMGANSLTFESPVVGLLPEGLDYNAETGQFLVGSLTQGTIYAITPADDGTATVEPLIEDADLMATVGIQVDAASHRLLVTNSAADAFLGGAGAAGLAAYDLETGERLFLVDLAPLYESATNFANDVAVDGEGSAYVTNSFAPVLYKVTADGDASVLVEDEQLAAPFLGGNGIVFVPYGYLLVANSGTQSLLKVTLGDEISVTPVELDVPFGADGMILADDDTLYAVANREDGQMIVRVSSDDEWTTATVTELSMTTDAATSITLQDGMPFYINAYLNDYLRTEYQLIGVDALMTP